MPGTGPQGKERLQTSIVPGEISHSLEKGRGLTATQPRTPPVSPTPAAPGTPRGVVLPVGGPPRGPSALRAKQPLSSLPAQAAHGRPPAPGCPHPEPLKPPVYKMPSEARASPQQEPRRPRARRQRVQPGRRALLSHAATGSRSHASLGLCPEVERRTCHPPQGERIREETITRGTDFHLTPRHLCPPPPIGSYRPQRGRRGAPRLGLETPRALAA